ncbi:MAG: H+-transporting ATPase [Thiomicrorhabdus sp.]|nr:MAG: H+-transporting ATPase [Thiomicrorhabdus sp.]
MNHNFKKTDAYLEQSIKKTLADFQVDPEEGLSETESLKRLDQFGSNAIIEKEESIFQRIARRFWGPIAWMIEAAAIMSAVVGKWEDFTIILMMLFVNAGLDFLQEHRALNALKALKQKLENTIITRRNGQFIQVKFKNLVPGDIIKLKIGDIVPADVLLITDGYLSIDQSSLTGESLPVSKKSGDIGYANTVIKQGEMLAVIVNTGNRTNFHKVVSLVASAQMHEESHFQKMVIKVGNFLIGLTLTMIAIILVSAYFRDENMMEIVRFALVLTIAAIPVALPAVLSVTMAIGALNLARKKAIVSRLVAIEELAGVDVFCLDKTGTLTQNKMTVFDSVVFNGYSEENLFLTAIQASKHENNDPIEQPIYQFFTEKYSHINPNLIQQVSFDPFDPVRKRTESILKNNELFFKATKGAAQVVLSMCQLDDKQQLKIENQVEEFAHKGYRTLAVAKTQEQNTLALSKSDQGWSFIGLIPMYDPPRVDSAEVLQDMRALGVHPKMITGDNLAIAREIGHLLRFPHKSIRAKQLTGATEDSLKKLLETLTQAIYHRLNPEIDSKTALSFAKDVISDLDKEFDTSQLDKELLHTHESSIIEMIEEVDIFAEVVPEDKYMIVDTLQKANHIVAMTGDGVNDAPALKKADCGIAVPNATDAARAAADIILMAPGIGVINDAIQQARITFERMKSYTIFRIAETIRVIIFMTLAIVVFQFYPLTALMIIMLALLNDIPILAIAYDNTKVQKNPVRWDMKEIIVLSSWLGIAGVISSFILFWYLMVEMNLPLELVQSLFFAKLVVAGHGTIYNTRINDWFFKKPWPSLPLFIATLSSRVIGTIIAVYGFGLMEPIGWEWAAFVWIYALVWFVFNDAIKMAVIRRYQKIKNGSVIYT